jgi:hypothetical protein
MLRLVWLALAGCADADLRSNDPESPCVPPEGMTVWYRDADADGWGDGGTVRYVRACEPPDGYVARSRDCDDGDPDWNPDAVDPCQTDAWDVDCDGTPAWYVDEDSDGFGTAAMASCDDPAAPRSGDCDDGDASRHPDVAEICGDGIDQDCSGDAPACGLEPEIPLEGDNPYPRIGGVLYDGGDVNGDGAADLLVAARGVSVGVYLGPFGFAEQEAAAWLSTPTGEDQFRAQLADLDGDGRDEVVAESPDGSGKRVWIVSDVLSRAYWGEGAAATVVEGAWPVFDGADTDGDGRDELAVMAGAASTWVPSLLGTPPPGTSFGPDLAVASFPGAAGLRSAGDLDGDGLEDVTWGAAEGIVAAHGPVRGEQTWAEADVRIAGPSATPLPAGDLDGDGHDDLVVSELGPVEATTRVYVLLAPLPSDLADASASFAGSGLSAVSGGSGDYDADGDGEILLFDPDSHNEATYVVTGPFAGAMHPRDALMARLTAGSVMGAYTADLNGDGFTDVAVRGSGRTWLLFGGPGL